MKSCFDQVQLVGFRNYRTASVILEPGPVVLFGANGAGKTNFLEALSLFAPGRGLRKAAARSIGNDADPQRGWAVSVGLRRGDLHHRLGTGFDPGSGGGPADGPDGSARDKRRLRIDGQNQRGQAVLPHYLSLLWLTPRMDGLFLDPASERRGFLDQMVMALDPAHADELAALTTSLRNRAKVLKQARDQGERADSPRVNQLWLSSIEESIARHAVAVAAARRQYVQRLTPLFETGQPPFPGGRMRLEGWLEQALDSQKALMLEEAYRATLAQGRAADQVSGRCAVGPHRSDLLLFHAAHGRPAAECSTGEQKGLLLALLLAHAALVRAHRGAAPILLLDEVAAHFDPLRRGALFEALAALEGQALMTGTHRDPFSALVGKAQFLQVTGGSIAVVP